MFRRRAVDVACYDTVAFGSGMRRGEVCGLRWADVDFSGGRVHIVNNIQYTEGTGTYDTNTKTKKNRDVFVSQKVVEILKEWKAFQKEIVEGQICSKKEKNPWNR